MLRVRAVSTGWGGGPGLSTVYFLSGTNDNSAASDAVDAVHSAWSYANSLFHATWGMDISGDVDVIDEGTGEITNTLSVNGPAHITGNGANANIMPPAVALVTSFSTGAFIAGRRLRGRTFLSPLHTSAAETDGTPTAAAIAYANGLGEILRDNVGDAGPAVIWHRPVNGVGGSASPITSISVRDVFAVLRSRRD